LTGLLILLVMTPSEIRGLAQSFRRFRRKDLLTQKALAEAMGICRREVQYIESGQRSVGYRVRRSFLALQSRYGPDAPRSA